MERVTRLQSHSTTFVPIIHSLTERSSEGQPAHTASGEDGTTGKDRLAKTPQARSVVGLRRGSIGRKGSPDGGRARGSRVIWRKWKVRAAHSFLEKEGGGEPMYQWIDTVNGRQTAPPTRELASEVEQSQFHYRICEWMLGWATSNGVSRMRGDPHVRFSGGSGRPAPTRLEGLRN